MEKISLFKWLCGISFMLISINSFAQNETNHWYFGVYAGLDFSSGSPVADGNGQVYTNEGCSAMSDAAGNLLFYTDGITVWNKNHEVMPNGTGLQGGSSSTQAALIVPSPANPNQYYLFTTDEIGGPNGFQFSIVDMTLQSGLGDVTIKDSLVRDTVTEKLAAVRQGHKGDYWIAVHHWGNNSYYVYSLTINGLSLTPVVSSIGTVLTTAVIQNTYGQLKFSPCGDKMASANGYLDTVDVFDFDIESGVVSNRVALPMPAHIYGVEFSPNEQFLYVTTYDLENGLLQYDLTAGTADEIIASKQVINFSEDLYAMQLGLDGKIYVCKSFYSHLGAINSPDLAGLDCDFDLNAVDLDPNFEGTTSALGLPDFVSSFLAPTSCTALGIDENSAASESLVFPNPSADYFTLESVKENSWVEIYNSQGMLIQKFVSDGKTKLQFGQNYSAGIYLITIKNEKENRSMKIMKSE
jgi:hypothetical protein